jgi:UDP-glucose 4-epimerase
MSGRGGAARGGSPGEGRLALVTGGAGFIGSHLVEALLAEGFAVRVLDDLSSGRRENLGPVAGRVELLVGDVCDESAVARAVEGAEVVFHHAAVASVPKSVDDPIRTHAVNVQGTVNLLDRARRAGARRVVFAASSAVYGDPAELPIRESALARPLSPYALHKYTGELHCRLFTALHGLETVALRYFNVYGPRQDPASDYAAVIPLFIEACRRGKAPTIFGDGEQTRDFVFVADVVRANLLAARSEAAVGTVVNVASGRATSVIELWELVADLCGSPLLPNFAAPRAGDVRDSVADVSGAASRLGFAPEVDLRDGLRATIESSSSRER